MAAEVPFPIVGIGASAGGLEALEGLFRGLPFDTGMAFVVVTHLARGHESALAEILGRFTHMPVLDASQNAAVQPDHVYVCPPDHILTIAKARLWLHPRASDQQHKPIDVFLSSLAADRAESAVGVVLSGSGSDGTLGMKGIKEHGGLTIAQGADGSGPRHKTMPQTAIAAGVVDLVLPAEQMGQRLAQYAREYRLPEIAVGERTNDEEADMREAKEAIYKILRNQVGHDFSGYKEKTFMRRVRRRMQVVEVRGTVDYVQRLRADPDEVRLLFRDLLIGVTNFFRDPDSFTALEQLVIPRLFAGRTIDETVRIWCPGCATGEEVYSLAILVREYLDTLSKPPKVQIFATDIDEPALAVARAGRYPAPLMTSVSPERLRRFFTSDDASHAVTKEIRNMCVFSVHSVVRDPPFSRIDLISCRNLLIYFGADFQQQVIPAFHFALRPRGFLFLGTCENVTQHGDLFASVDKKHRIFQRRDHALAPRHLPLHVTARRGAPDAERKPDARSATANLRRAVDARVLDCFAPAHVVVNREGDILHYSARTGKYLEAAAGLPNRQLITMARRGLRLQLRAALREAIDGRRRTVRDRIAVEIDDRMQLINLVVEPFGEDEADPLFLVLFNDVGAPFSPGDPVLEAHGQSHGNRAAEPIEQELRDTRERLQASVEEYEAALEELKSSNEELQSINEELQSTNEEMETSKEELQSVNEELHTVNAELRDKVDALDRANADLRNVFDSTQVAMVFLDYDLVIRTFTPAVVGIFNLISTDRGRPLTDIVSHLDHGDLQREIRLALERGEIIERNVRRKHGRAQYLMRILPYYGSHGSIEGVLVTFVDVTTLIEAEAHHRLLVEELNHRVRNMLTVVNAIAKQTLAQTKSPEAFADAFTGRVQAMGNAYTLVSQQHWGDVDLRALVDGQLGPYVLDGASRIQIAGPEVCFKPNAALALGLVIHEFATNATKHGSLSGPHGRVALTWAVEGAPPQALLLRWIERGGPPAKKPTRKGFGTQLIEREFKHTLNAKSKLDFNEHGFSAVVSIPWSAGLVSLRLHDEAAQ